MKQEKNSVIKFVKSSGIFFVGSILSKAIVFFMLPVYTKYIAPADYGYYDLSITYITVVSSMLFFDVWTSVMRFMYDSNSETYKYKAIQSGWHIFGFSSLCYAILGTVLACLTDIRYLGWILLYGLFSNIQSMYDFIARGFGKNVEFAISGIINTLITVFLNLIFIVKLGYNFSSLYVSTIIGNVAQIIYLEFKVKLLSRSHLQKTAHALTKQMFFYTLPLCVNSVSYWLLTGFNRVVINTIMGDTANGIYAVGNKFGAIISLITGCFVYAWQDISFSRQVDDKSNGKFYSNACQQYLLFLGTGTVLLLPVLNILFPFLVNRAYERAKETIPLFLLVAMTAAYSTFIGNIFYALKDTKAIFKSMVISCLFNLALCYPLIRWLGLDGANLSIFLSFLLNIAIRAVILKREIGFNLSLKTSLSVTFWILISIVTYLFCKPVINLIWLLLCLVRVWKLYNAKMHMLWKAIKEKSIK
ncbi:MAG TPA: hypothetical protein DC024_06900 [Clostridiales bacterium]|jgi:O-antigen/teichoic acid export membrane protein|nr:hypothetical protein [Clostridiales bacterium]